MTAPVQLRDYQHKAIDDLRAAIKRGRRSLLLVSPTGSGKTTIAAAMIRSALAKGKRILFLAHRQELIDQCSDRLNDMGVEHGVIMGNDRRRKPWLSVHVCSVPTLARRERLPIADLIYVDECHRSASESYIKVMRRYPNAVSIGLSATPARLDGKPLTMFQEIVLCPSVAELTDMGYLVPSRIFAPSQPDLSGVGKVGGDYKNDDLAKAMDKPKLVGDIVDHWARLGANQITICFAVNIQHSRDIMAKFRAMGVSCEHIDSDTPKDERRVILRRFKSGEVRVLTNVQICTEGYDNPAAAHEILARPTLSTTLYLQMCGRVLRPHGDKKFAVIQDHAGCVLEHGFPEDDRAWSLTGSVRKKRGAEYDPALAVRMCLECWCAFRSTEPKCPICGWVYVSRKQDIKTVAGELQEITESPAAKAYVIKKLSPDPIMAHFQKEAEAKGYSHRWAWVQADKARKGEIYVDRGVFSKWQAFERGRRGAA